MTRSTSAPMRSILFTNSKVGTRSRCRARIRIRVCGWTPSTAESTSTAPSSTPRARSTSAMKSGCPGVSTTLTVVPSSGNDTTAALIVMPRRRSRARLSVRVVPESTDPGSSMTPARCRSRSVRVVLPASTWARMPTLSERTGGGTRDPFEVAEQGGSVRCSHLGASWDHVAGPSGRRHGTTYRRCGSTGLTRRRVRDMQARRRDQGLPLAGQGTTLELFFDLVFVFTITQLTASELEGGWGVTARTALLLLLLWWMYGGYAWLTNAAPPVTPRRRSLLVLGMIGFFVTALAIPHAYGADRVVFACGYLFVVAVHAGMYVTEAARITRGMVVQLLGWNILGAVLGLVGALFFEDVLAWWWLASFVVAVVVPRFVSISSLNQVEPDGGPSFELVPGHFVERPGLMLLIALGGAGLAADGGPSFELVPGHFVERHGLMLLIALGESVLAIGVGLGTGVESIGADRIVFAAVSLLLAATLYWAYFGTGEDDRAEAALRAMSPEQAQAAALASYGYAFWVVLFGIVLAAAGLHHALVHPTEALSWEYAGQLCGGVGLFWVGLGLFRMALHLPGAGSRVAGGLALGALVVVGAGVSGLSALVCLLLGSAALVLWEGRQSPESAEAGA